MGRVARRATVAVALLFVAVLGTASQTLPASATLSDADARAIIDRATVQVLAFSCDFEAHDGSGVSIAGAGLVTVRHVVGASRIVDVAADDQPTTPAASVAVSAIDLATVTAPGMTMTSLVMTPTDPRPGASVRLGGFPGAQPGVRPPGLVVDDMRVVNYVAGASLGVSGPVMRLSGSVADGMSGGPVVDGSGRVAGIIFGNEVPTGNALAIPASELRQALREPLASTEC